VGRLHAMAKVILIGLVLIVAVCGCIGDRTTALMNSYDRADALSVATGFIRANGGGYAITCDDTGQNGTSYMLRCRYVERYNKTANHVMDLVVDSGAVKKAVLDGRPVSM